MHASEGCRVSARAAASSTLSSNTRNVLGCRDAQHAEYDRYASDLFVTRRDCSLVGRERTITFELESRVAGIYGALVAREQYYCNFAVNPEKRAILGSGELRITGSDREGEVRVVELPKHQFFIGTLFVPQLRSRVDRPHPLITAIIRAAVRGRCKGSSEESPPLPPSNTTAGSSTVIAPSPGSIRRCCC